jgi:4-hydroxybutyryl-CoA dehydratase/vinylacetyl-CoA-Delta-isomerase
MGIMTKDEYIESIRKLNPVVYMFGEKISNVVDNPRLRAGIEATGATYELAGKAEYRDLFVTNSPLINEPVNRFTLPPGSIEDLVARVKINRTLGNWVGTCHQRCTGLDCLADPGVEKGRRGICPGICRPVGYSRNRSCRRPQQPGQPGAGWL